MIEFFSVLAIWRITFALSQEDGPGNIFVNFRSRYFIAGDIGGKQIKDSFIASLIGCFYCLSFWVALPFALYLTHDSLLALPVHWFGISALAIFLNLFHERIKGE